MSEDGLFVGSRAVAVVVVVVDFVGFLALVVFLLWPREVVVVGEDVFFVGGETLVWAWGFLFFGEDLSCCLVGGEAAVVACCPAAARRDRHVIVVGVVVVVVIVDAWNGQEPGSLLVAVAADALALVYLVEGAKVVGWVGEVGTGDLALFGARRESLGGARAEVEVLRVGALVTTARIAAAGERDLV